METNNLQYRAISLSDAFFDPFETKNHHVAVSRIELKLSRVQPIQISEQYLDWLGKASLFGARRYTLRVASVKNLDWLTIYKAKRVQFLSF